MDILSENGLVSSRIREEKAFRPDSTAPPFPRTVYFEISNLCNHACVFCAYPKMTRRGRRMNLDLLHRLMRDAYELGSREIAFYAGAEPFMSPDLEADIKLAKDIGYEYIFITTNGSLATEPRLKACIDNGLDSIKFSINGADRDTYRRIHGKDDFERVIEHVRFASEHRQATGRRLHICVSFVMIDNEIGSNSGTRTRIHEIVGPYVDEVVFFEAGTLNGQNYGLSPMEIEPPCPLPFTRLHVSAEGYLRLCCNDYQNYLAVADLNQTSLTSAWTSEVFTEMRRRHLAASLDGTLCHNCVNNVNTPIEPLVAALATVVDRKFFTVTPVSKRRG